MRDLAAEIRAYVDSVDEPFDPGELMTKADRISVTPGPFSRSSRRRLSVALGAAVMVLMVVGGVALLTHFLGGNESQVADQTVPSTSPVVESTTSVAGRTAETPVLGWRRLEDATGAFGGPGKYMVFDLIVGGPGLVGVGTDDGAVGITPGMPTGWGYEPSINNRGAAVWLSEDGFSWTRVAHDESIFGGDVATMTSVADNGSRLVAVGIASAEHIGDETFGGFGGWGSAVWVSDDRGLSWTRVPHNEDIFGGEGAHRMFAVFVNDQGFVALGDDVWTSPDGWTWTRLGELAGPRRVTRTDSGFVAVGEDAYQSAVWTSPNGIDWTRVEPTDPRLFGSDSIDLMWVLMSDIEATPFGVVAVGQANTSVSRDSTLNGDAAAWVSEDGIDWSRVTHNTDVFGAVEGGFHQTMRSVAVYEDLLIAVGDQRRRNPIAFDPRFGPALSWVSEDGGQAWTRLMDTEGALGSRGDPIALRNVAVLNGTIVATGSDGDDLAVWIGEWQP